MKPRMTLEWIGFLLIALCLGVVQFNLFVAQSLLLSLAAIAWIIVASRDRRLPEVPAFFLPLLVYALLTLLSAAFSSAPVKSLVDSKQLLMFLVVPIVARLVRGEKATTAIDIIIAIGAAGALWGIIQFTLLGYNNLEHRPVGPLSHWMTYSGVLMLVICTAVARLLFRPTQFAWPVVAVPALLAALVVTNTRNAWIGAFLAITVLLAIKNWKLIIIPPVIAILAFFVAPGEVQRRAQSMLHPTDPASIDRVVMWKIGADMVRDHPVFGVGPEMVQEKYEAYRERYPEAVNKRNPHLHNVPIQIAAERGIPALLAWLWFVIVALRDLWRQLRRGVATPVAAAGLAAVVAMLAAGLFEYNFGDSEFLILFLGLITLPFAASMASRETDPLVRASPGATR